MRRTILSAVCLVAISAGSGGASTAVDADASLYAFGHVHQLENDGFFFPGTTICPPGGCTAVTVLEVEQGSNVTFMNFDEEPHQVAADKNAKKTRRPLFFSDAIGRGDETKIVTANLKPGSYPFHCVIHLSMKGTLVVK